MLSVKNRQKYMKALGLYDSLLDGKEGAMTKAGYKALQDKYFTREKDKDGLYGPNTDILLRNAYNVELYTRNFDVNEFKCDCGGKYCTGYPVRLNVQMLKNMQAIRTKFGPTTIASGMRCQKYNDSIPGSISNSWHTKGMAVDFYGNYTNTLAERQKVEAYCRKLPNAGYTYSNDAKNTYPWMGTSVHTQVNK